MSEDDFLDSDLQSEDHKSLLMLAWEEFQRKYPTEEDCIRALTRRICQGFRCIRCDHDIPEGSIGARKIKCERCKEHFRPTAGTFFHRARRLMPYLARIEFFELGVCVSSLGFSKLLNIAPSTALEIFKKLTTVVMSQFGSEAIDIPSEELLQVVFRRSRATPAFEHPVEEERVMSERAFGQFARSADQADSLASSEGLGANSGFVERAIDATTIGDANEVVYGALSLEPIPLQSLCQSLSMPVWQVLQILTLLELEGRIKSLAGQLYARVPSSQAGGLRQPHVLLDGPRNNQTEDEGARRRRISTVRGVIGYMRYFFRGISRKCMQYYAAAHWCFNDRGYWGADELLNACLDKGLVHTRDVRDYVTPLLVRATTVRRLAGFG
jgi:hypothetical protein